MSKQRINSFGGRTHSTPFTTYDTSKGYTSRVVTNITTSLSSVTNNISLSSMSSFWTVSGALTGSPYFTVTSNASDVSVNLTGTLTGTRIYVTETIPLVDNELASKGYVDSITAASVAVTGTISAVGFFHSDKSLTSDVTNFRYDDNTNELFVLSASVSSMQLNREDYHSSDNNSIIKSIGNSILTWDTPYFANGLYREIMIHKELNATGMNFRYLGLEYSDVTHHRKVTTLNTGGYSYVIHWAQYGTTINEAGMRTNIGSKRFTYKQITTPIRSASSLTNHRVWIGISDTPLSLIDYDAPSTYNVIAFRYIAGTTNWHGYMADGAAATTLDLGVAYSVDTNYVLKIVMDGIAANFFINGNYVGSISSNLPSSTQDMYMVNMIKNTATSTSTKELGIAHVHLVMS